LSSGDSVLATNVSWTADGGTIGVDGKFHSVTPGHYKIIGRVSDGSTAPDTATVNVVNSGSAVPTGLTHQPLGMVRVTSRAFNALIEDSWGYAANGNFTVVRDSSPPSGASDSLVGQIRFPAGFGAGASPAWTDRESLPSTLRFRTIYVSFWLKVSANWYGQSVVNKVAIMWIGGKPKCVVGLRGSGTGALTLQLYAQDLAVPAGTDTGLNLVNTLSAGNFSRGQWHHVEVVLGANTTTGTTAASDGQAQWWLDGQPVGSASTIPWVGPGESATWELFAWNPIWGGLGGTVPAEQYMWMDQYYASGK
jgi:hypothetical protein